MKKDILKILIDKDLNISKLAKIMGMSRQTLAARLDSENIGIQNLDEILSVLGYELKIVSKEV